MPYCYCHNEACIEFDFPTWIDPVVGDPGPAAEGDCAKNCPLLCKGMGVCVACAGRRHARPSVPLATQRFRSVARAAQKPPPSLSPVPRVGPIRFYCQNPNQSGDSTGVGMALAMFDEMSLLFAVSMNNPGVATAFLTYYQDMGAIPDRVLLLVCDTEKIQLSPAESRKQELAAKQAATEEIARKTRPMDEELVVLKAREAILLKKLSLAAGGDLRVKLAALKDPDPELATELRQLWTRRTELNGLLVQAKKTELDRENDATLAWKNFTIDETTELVQKRPDSVAQTDITLSSMSLDRLLDLLRLHDWPACPLYVPGELTPSQLQVDEQSDWRYVDPCTALDAIRNENEEMDIAIHDARITLDVLPGWLDRHAASLDPDIPPLALQIAQRELNRIRGVPASARAQRAAHNAALDSPRFHEAILTSVGRSGIGIPELLGRLRVARAYCLFLYSCADVRHNVLLIARAKRDLPLDKLGPALHLQPGGEIVELTRAEPVVAGAAKRFNVARDLLVLKLGRRDEKARRYALFETAMPALAPKLKALAGRIMPWKYFDERAGNQLYQELTCLAIKLRDNEVALQSADDASGYQTMMRIPAHDYFPIGDTSRHILAVLQQQGLPELNRRLAARLAAGCDRVRPALKSHFLDDFVRGKLDEAKGKRLMFVLIWVRGVNSNEMQKLQTGLGDEFSLTIGDGMLKQLDPMKRNPHHVMTAQLCNQISLLFECFNGKHGECASPDPERYFVPIPIGDPVHIDQYNHDSRRVCSEAVTNMINLWARPDQPELADAIGGPHWRYRQVAMMRELFIDGRFDLMQIGIRSGALEQGMYQGVPSVYIEEHMCATGDRMVSLTREGPSRAKMDLKLRVIYSKVLTGEYNPAPQEPREGFDAPAMPDPRAAILAFREACDQVFVSGSQDALSKWYEDFASLAKLAAVCRELDPFIAAIVEAIAGKAAARSEAFPPEPDGSCGGFPLFFRLITSNLVGLNQARSLESLEKFEERFIGKLLHPERELGAATEEMARVARGALQGEEIRRLIDYVGVICKNYQGVKAQIT